MENNFVQSLLRINPEFNTTDIKLGVGFVEELDLKANQFLLLEGETCEHLYFAESSICRCFYKDDKGAEQTLWMKPEQSFLTEFKSFTSGEKSGFTLQVYEDTKVFRISRKNLKELYRQSTNWALFGILFTEHVHVSLIDVFSSLLANDATRNYEYIAYRFPRFIQVAPLKDIASMLQISTVSLSRIRAGTQKKAN